MTHRYIFRAKKPKFKYHVTTAESTACNMQNSTCFRKLDTYSDEPPPGRTLCGICAHMLGLPVPVRRACEALLPPYPPLTPRQTAPPERLSKGPHDKLLARFGVLIAKKSPDFQKESIRVCQQHYVKLFGREYPRLSYPAARSALGQIKTGGCPNPPPGMMPLPRPKQIKTVKIPKSERKKAKKSKAVPQREMSAATLTKEQTAFIISDAFLSGYEWRKVRYEAIKRSNGCCEACGRGKPHGAVLNVDHILNRRKRPDLALVLSNLQVLCGPCNHGKGNWDSTDWRNRTPEMMPEEREWEREAWERFK